MRILVHTKKYFAAFAMALLLMTVPFVQEADASSAKSDGILEVAHSLKGVPYVYGGTTTSGFDCSGYISYVFKKNGIDLPRTTKGMYATGTAVKKSQLQQGDLVFFNTLGNGVSHAGIYVGDGKFIHASTSHGVRVDRLDDPYYWGDKYIGAKRIAGVQIAAR